MAIDRNKELKKLHTFNDKAADSITKVAGSMPFLLLNIVWFVAWILLNEGVFGQDLVVDKFPFSFLTTAVSLEAIVLSTFVLMSQRRQSKLSEHRTELDYRSDLKAEVDIRVMLGILERLAHHQSVDIRDLLAEMEGDERKASRSARQFSE
jgi:uncharacterized membrane protein